jgi:hypothetical protein
MPDPEGFEKAIVTLVIDEKGTVIAAQENGWELVYGEKKVGELEKRRIDEGAFSIRSASPCTWRKRNGRWVCI